MPAEEVSYEEGLLLEELEGTRKVLEEYRSEEKDEYRRSAVVEGMEFRRRSMVRLARDAAAAEEAVAERKRRRGEEVSSNSKHKLVYFQNMSKLWGSWGVDLRTPYRIFGDSEVKEFVLKFEAASKRSTQPLWDWFEADWERWDWDWEASSLGAVSAVRSLSQGGTGEPAGRRPFSFER